MTENVIIKVKDVEGELEGAPLWITTFVDMISLLVTFFILLFTFSSIRDFDNFAYLRDLTGTRGVVPGENQADLVAPDDDIMQAYDISRGARHPHARSASELQENMEEMGQDLTEDHVPIDLNKAKSGLRVDFPARAGFAPGSARVNMPLRQALGEMGRTLEHYPYTVLIEGFTDDAFRPSPDYPSARHLSLARAEAAAAVLLEESGMPPALLQISAPSGRPARSTSSDSAVGRRAERRVEVVIVAMERGRAKLYERELDR